ncbi:MAG: long-chain fatty acid--CoA ligase [Rhodothermia bacterium]|nr:long-chain fatty acid--CoA ligase [Rhodothermia bacterium]
MQKTLLQLVEEGYPLNKSGVCMAVKRDGKWVETSIEDFRKNVARVAMGLYDLGIRKGDRVGLHSENSTEWILCDQAILSLGAVTVPIYATQPGDQIKYILEDSEAKVHITSSEKLFKAFAPFVDTLPDIKLVGILDRFHPRMMTLDELKERGKERLRNDDTVYPAMVAEVHPEDLATLIYTSGTTGMPKGVMLTHWNIVSNVIAVKEHGFFVNTEEHGGGKLLSYLPLSHIFERCMTFLAISSGFPMYFIPNIDTFTVDIQEVKPVHFTTVPRLLEKVYTGIQTKVEATPGAKGKLARWAFEKANNYNVGDPKTGLGWKLADKLVLSKFRELFGGNLVGVTSGGAALPAKIMRFMNGIGIPTAQGYGLTETSPVLTIYNKDRLVAGSAGVVLKGVEIKLIPVEGGVDGEGEILAKGPNIMKGYYKKPAETAEVLSEDGWFATGDIGRFDESGNLFITDRKKELLKLSTGKYIAPAPIENELVLTPEIEQAIVIGNGQKFCSALLVLNVPALLHELKERGHILTEDQVWDHPEAHNHLMKVIKSCNHKLPHWEQIKDFRLLKEPFSIEGGELTPKLSMKRRVIQEKYGEVIATMYQE